MGNPFSKHHDHKYDVYTSAKTTHPIILPIPTKKYHPKTATSTNVCRHLKKIIKCFTFLTQQNNDNIDKPRPHKKIRKRIKKVYKYKPATLPNNNVTRTGSEITMMPPPPTHLLPPELQLHWIRSKRSMLSYALSKLAFFSKNSKEKLPPDNVTDNQQPSKQIKFCYKNKTRTSVNATSSTTGKEAIIPTSTQGHQISLYDLKMDQEHQISLSDIEINQGRQIRLSNLKIDQGDQTNFDNKKDQGHQISLYDLNNNLTLKNVLLAKILSSPTIGAANDKYNFLRRKRSLSPEQIFRRNLRRFETLLAITESLSSISSCASVSMDMESVKLSEKIIQTEVVDENNNDVQQEQEHDITVMQAEYTGELDENGNPINKSSQESSVGKKSSEKMGMRATATATTTSIESRPNLTQEGNITNFSGSSAASHLQRRIITRSKSPVEIDTYFMDWVKARLFKSPDESGEPPSTVVGQVETTITSLSSHSSSCSSEETKKSDKDDTHKGDDKDYNNNDKDKDDKAEKRKKPFEYLRKGGGRRASTAGRDWSESRSKSRSPEGAERKNKKGKGKGSKTKKGGTATTTTTETSESTVKTEEDATKTQTTGKKKEEAKTEAPPARPCEKCGPCAGKYAMAGAPPAYLDYGEGEYANQTGQAWKGKRKGDPVMDRLKNVDVVEEMTYLVPNPPDCGGGGDACREEEEEIDDDCDYYAVCESCGEMEPIPEELKKELQAKRRRKKRKGKGESLPVTYSRRQRFNFKNKGDMCDDDDGPPYPYEGQQCPGCRCTCCVAGLRRDQDCGCKCCQTMGPLRKCNSFDEIPVGKNPQIRRILAQEEECARRREICMQQMPDNSGMYKFDKEHKMFERQVPRTPTPIILEVEVPEPLTKEQLVAIGRGIQEKKRLGMPVGPQAHCPPIEQDPVYLPPVYGQCNPPQCPPPCCVPNYCCPDKPGDGDDQGKSKKDKKRRRIESGTVSGSGSYPPESSYSHSTGYTNDDKTTTGLTVSGRTFQTTRTSRTTGIRKQSKKSQYSTLYSSQKTPIPETLDSESSGSLPSL